MKRTRPALRRILGWFKRRRWLLVQIMVAMAMSVAAVLFLIKPEKGFAPGQPVAIAVVYPQENDSADFLAAIRIAAEQVNAQGGFLGHPLELRLFEEENYTGASDIEGLVSRTLDLASGIGNTSSILAVIGHGSSATAIPASSVYNRHKKLFMATHATATSLSNLHFDLTFALQPNNADNANMLSTYALSQGLNRIIVLSDDSNYGIETTNQFRSLFAQNGGTILLHTRMTSANRSIDDLLLFIMDNELFSPKEIDAFFITSSNLEATANFILKTRQLGLHIPILGPEYLYSHELEQMVGPQAMREVTAVSVLDQGQTTPEGQSLSGPFEKATGHKPGLLAAVGYDAVKVLAHAVKKAGQLDPDAIADTLRIIRYDAPFVGATGPMTFDAQGLVTDTSAYVVRHDGTRFNTVATYRKPFDRGEDKNSTEATPKPASERNQKP